MSPDRMTDLSRRERQIMEALYRLGEASVSELVRLIPDRPSYDSIRLTLGVLAEKNQVSHRREGRKYVYRPAVSHEEASRSAIKNVMQTYFRGSPRDAILAMLDESSVRLSPAELDDLAAQIRRAKEAQK